MVFHIMRPEAFVPISMSQRSFFFFFNYRPKSTILFQPFSASVEMLY